MLLYPRHAAAPRFGRAPGADRAARQGGTIMAEYITCQDEKGSVNISEDVVAVVVGAAMITGVYPVDKQTAWWQTFLEEIVFVSKFGWL